MFNSRNRVFISFLALFVSLILIGASCQKQGNNSFDFDGLNGEEPIISSGGDNEIIEGEQDEHGCDLLAGYIWCQSKEKCLRTLEEDCPATSYQNNEAKEEKKSIAAEIEWKNYYNGTFGYSLKYPIISDVLGDDVNERVEFVGPKEDGERWPRFSISHYSSAFYSPDEGVDVKEWVKMHPSFTAGEDRTIAGLPAVHFVQVKSQQAYAGDYYYLINDGQLYEIVILHAGGRQDWPVYEQFLNSFSFE